MIAFQQSDAFLRAARALDWPVAAREDAGRRWIEHWRGPRWPSPVRLVSRGPGCRDWLAARGAEPCVTLLNAEGVSPSDLRRAGYWPLMTPVTLARLPLGPEAAMRARMAQKWRNRLNAAARTGLELRHVPMPADADHWLLQADAAQARRAGYAAWPPALVVAWVVTSPGTAVLFEARVSGRPVAGLILLRHGPGATYHVAHSRPEGRARHAMQALLWEAMLWAQAESVREIDLGAIDTHGGRGLARFKLGTGARPHRLSGTWGHHKVLAPLARRLPLSWAA
ncbi:GNAT family N-acetyltransferase [Roseivivax marinus]|uniref:GNAT family N-acetyltransferase n=1 Tax=Roseivivax marinus TaxID=1379903 RepID=UPI001F0367B3|nr:GNAT family N-acetyltransferase [Roseivivax marinus]UMA65642.1 GNAT family N-acetyltransferase [Roseivivax marinus]